ncbi:MAG: hypothetical protein MK358_11275, partial [Vicinamibacterales bacterium]|nr:hypothetical protein [Vicinamibacterales bacterium]
AVAACLTLAFGAGGADLTGGMVLWPLFGTTNQLLAALTLLVISIVLVRAGRPARYTMVPMVFVSTAALLAALYQLWAFFQSAQYMLLVLAAVIVISAVFVMLEAIAAFGRRTSA